MAVSLNNPALEKLLKDAFPEVSVGYREIIQGGKLYVFFLSFPDESNLETNWRKIANAIAVYFQSKLTDEFEKWNIYLFYQCTGTIDRDLKYRIENDTFSSRKIVVSGNPGEDGIITDYITNNNLVLAPAAEEESFDKNAMIWDAINGRQVRKRRTSSDVAQDVLNKIIKAIKQENK